MFSEGISQGRHPDVTTFHCCLHSGGFSCKKHKTNHFFIVLSTLDNLVAITLYYIPVIYKLAVRLNWDSSANTTHEQLVNRVVTTLLAVLLQLVRFYVYS